MRRKDRAMSKSEAWAFIKEHNVGRLGVISQNAPYVVPMNYAVIEGAIYCHSASKGRKIRAIEENDAVCFEVDEVVGLHKAKKACQFTMNYRSVIAEGKATFIVDSQEKADILNVFMESYAASDTFEPVNPSDVLDIAVIKITIDHLTGKQHLSH